MKPHKNQHKYICGNCGKTNFIAELDGILSTRIRCKKCRGNMWQSEYEKEKEAKP